MSRSFMRMIHKVDLYTKGSTTNDTGQKRGSWSLYSQDVKCFFTPSGSSTNIKLNPTMEEADWYTMYFEHDAPVDYGTRLENLTTFDGEVIYAGPLQVMQIDKHVAPMSGKVQYLQLRVKTVIE